MWADDWKQVLINNLEGIAHTWMVTVTAPGVDAGLAWDRSRCKHGPEEKCSGPKGCVVVEKVRNRWNETALTNWAKLHRAAAARARRRHGAGPIIAGKAAEMQRRGVLHLHLVLDAKPGPDRKRAETYVAALNELAPRYWWGHTNVQREFDGAGGIRSAIYCAKYVVKATVTEGVRRPMYVGAHLTQRTGITMRALRWRRYLHHVLGLRPSSEELPLLIALWEAFAPEVLPEPVQARGP